MGLFKRKPPTDQATITAITALAAHQSDIEALRAAMVELNTRLEASENVRKTLETKVQLIDATTLSLINKTDGLDDLTRRMGEVDAMKEQVAEVDAIKQQVAQLDVVNSKIASLDDLNTRLTELAQRVTVTADDARQAKDQTASLHERISNVSVELANQLGELSREIDGIAGRAAAAAMPPPAPVFDPLQTMAEELVDQLRISQVKLANEQARYEIAFRQDLAMLAEQVKRSLDTPAETPVSGAALAPELQPPAQPATHQLPEPQPAPDW
jgi:DNA repair exonuclease SbcCD ATPase subunit